MIIHTDGSYSTQQMDLAARNGIGLSPGYGLFESEMGRAIPDGQGGVVTQVAIDSGGTLYHFSSSGTAKLGLAITPEVCPSYGAGHATRSCSVQTVPLTCTVVEGFGRCRDRQNSASNVNDHKKCRFCNSAFSFGFFCEPPRGAEASTVTCGVVGRVQDREAAF
jgi:hypothetical protein